MGRWAAILFLRPEVLGEKQTWTRFFLARFSVFDYWSRILQSGKKNKYSWGKPVIALDIDWRLIFLLNAHRAGRKPQKSEVWELENRNRSLRPKWAISSSSGKSKVRSWNLGYIFKIELLMVGQLFFCSRLLKKIELNKAFPVKTSLYMAFSHSFSFSTVLAAN